MKQRITMDQRNTNKQLRFYDTDGDHMRLSADETVARGLNKWQGWSCGAGVKNLYIDYDGGVWVCNKASAHIGRLDIPRWEQYLLEHPDDDSEALEKRFQKSDMAWKKDVDGPGRLGDIFTGFALPRSWFTCQWKECGCGADIYIPKAKSDQIAKLVVCAEGFDGRNATLDRLVDEVEQPVAMEPNFPILYKFCGTWDVGVTTIVPIAGHRRITVMRNISRSKSCNGRPIG